MTRWQKWLSLCALATVAPVLFFVLLEGALYFFNYGYSTSFFLKIDGHNAYTTNQHYGWRFFPAAMARAPIPCYLPANKSPDTYRIFVLGGSAALGIPDPAFSFGRILQVMLRDEYPDVQFEVINASVTAVNSNVVRLIAEDCARYAPDLFIVYLGNNEVVGPYGAGTVFSAYSPSRLMIRSSIWIKSTRMGQLLANVTRSARRGEEELEQWQGMRMFLARLVPADHPRMKTIYSHFRDNLTDICETAHAAGAKTIVCTVATNLKDSAPFASVHRPDLSERDKAKWESTYNAGIQWDKTGEYSKAGENYLEAAGIDDGFAELHFRLAKHFLTLKQLRQAGKHYRLARDLDALRFRADTRVNEIIREVADDQEAAGIYLADVERAFEHVPEIPARLPGAELFYDHVHMNFDGNYLLARGVFEKIAAILPTPIQRDASAQSTPLSRDDCAQRLLLTGWNEYKMAEEIFKMMDRPPFTNQLDSEQKRNLRRRTLMEMKKEYAAPQALQDAILEYEQAIGNTDGDLSFQENFAALLRAHRDYSGAAKQLRNLLRRVPGTVQWQTSLGLVLMDHGDLSGAIEQFRRALRIYPNRAILHFDLGLALGKQGELAGAIEEFQQALRLYPGFALARKNLDVALEKQRQSAEVGR